MMRSPYYISMLMRQSFAEAVGKRFVIYLADQGHYEYSNSYHIDANNTERMQNRQKQSVSTVFNDKTAKS